MHDLVTDLLDLAGLALVAVGLGLVVTGSLVAFVVLAIGVGAGVSGVVLLAGSRLIDWQTNPQRSPRWWPKRSGS